MAIWLIIRKYISLKCAIWRIKRAKVNAYRQSIKLPPTYPFYEQIVRWTFSGIKTSLIYSFCWCLICKWRKQRRSTWDTLWTDGTLPNAIMKSFAGLLVGLLFTHFLTLFLIFQLNFEPVSTVYGCFMLGLVLILGLSFSEGTRCFVFLTVPQFFTKKGRAAILAYCFILALSGPGKNTTRNMEILTESLICGQEMAHNATQGLMNLVKDPMSALGATFMKMKEAIMEVAGHLKSGIGALIRAIMSVVNAIKAAINALKEITAMCNKELGTPYDRCIAVFDTAIADCKVELGILDWMCSIVTVVQHICNLAKVVDLLCWLPGLIKEVVFNPIKEQLGKITDTIKTFFDVRLNFTDFYKLKHSFNSSKTFHQVVMGMKSEVMDQVNWFLKYMDWVNLLVSMFMFMAFYKAIIYRRRFLNIDRHDNFYITKGLVRLDLTRRRLGRETIFPLKYRESYTFVQPFSFVLIPEEQKALKFQLMLVLIGSVKVCSYLLLDYAFYRFLLLVKKHGAIEVDTRKVLGYNVKVQGEGFMADMYRAILYALSPIGELLPVFDTTPCLPIPSKPNYYEYAMILFLLLVCIIAAITEPYGMRLRHIICEIYYPDRKGARDRWLYTHILSARGNFLVFARSKVKGMLGGNKNAYEVGILDRLSHTVPGFRRLMYFIGARKKKCFLCGKAGELDNREDFVDCPSCDSVYCNDCYEEVDYRCIACLSPIEFGDVSEESGSHSSDDDDGEGYIAQTRKISLQLVIKDSNSKVKLSSKKAAEAEAPLKKSKRSSDEDEDGPPKTSTAPQSSTSVFSDRDEQDEDGTSGTSAVPDTERSTKQFSDSDSSDEDEDGTTGTSTVPDTERSIKPSSDSLDDEDDGTSTTSTGPDTEQSTKHSNDSSDNEPSVPSTVPRPKNVTKPSDGSTGQVQVDNRTSRSNSKQSTKFLRSSSGDDDHSTSVISDMPDTAQTSKPDSGSSAVYDQDGESSETSALPDTKKIRQPYISSSGGKKQRGQSESDSSAEDYQEDETSVTSAMPATNQSRKLSSSKSGKPYSDSNGGTKSGKPYSGLHRGTKSGKPYSGSKGGTKSGKQDSGSRGGRKPNGQPDSDSSAEDDQYEESSVTSATPGTTQRSKPFSGSRGGTKRWSKPYSGSSGSSFRISAATEGPRRGSTVKSWTHESAAHTQQRLSRNSLFSSISSRVEELDAFYEGRSISCPPHEIPFIHPSDEEQDGSSASVTSALPDTKETDYDSRETSSSSGPPGTAGGPRRGSTIQAWAEQAAAHTRQRSSRNNLNPSIAARVAELDAFYEGMPYPPDTNISRV